MTKTAIKTRRIGRSNLQVTELGLGGSGIAGLFSAVPDDQARATVAAALDFGIGYYDTAPFYGFGRSEHILGDVLRYRRGEAVLSTKVGRLLVPHRGDNAGRDGWANPLQFKPVYDYSYDGLMRSLDDSLQRLGVAEVDVLLVHDIGTMNHGHEGNREHWRSLVEGGYRALDKLRAGGVVKAIGIGVNEWEVLGAALDVGDWDVFMLAGRYTLLEQTPLELLATCLARGISVISAAPFNSGALVGGGKWNYGDAPETIVRRVENLRTFCEKRDVPIGAAALQFPLAHPAVCSVLPGPRSPQEVASVVGWYEHAIPASFWTELAVSRLVAAGVPLPGGVVCA